MLCHRDIVIYLYYENRTTDTHTLIYTMKNMRRIHTDLHYEKLATDTHWWFTLTHVTDSMLKQYVSVDVIDVPDVHVVRSDRYCRQPVSVDMTDVVDE